MNDNVRTLGAVPRIDHAELVANGLEEMARDVRAGKLPFVPARALIMLSGRGTGVDDTCTAFYGGEASTAEIVGMLELAKHQVIEEAG